MKFINRDMDRKLLFLILGLLVIFAAFTVYYETNMRQVLKEYDSKNERFSEITANFVVQELNRTYSLKENVKIDKEYLENKYNDLAHANENLKKQIEDLNAELILVKSQAEYQKAKDQGPSQQFVLFQKKNEEIGSLRLRIKNLCARLSFWNATDVNCQD